MNELLLAIENLEDAWNQAKQHVRATLLVRESSWILHAMREVIRLAKEQKGGSVEFDFDKAQDAAKEAVENHDRDKLFTPPTRLTFATFFYQGARWQHSQSQSTDQELSRAIALQDQTRGYPTAKEWSELVSVCKALQSQSAGEKYCKHRWMDGLTPCPTCARELKPAEASPTEFALALEDIHNGLMSFTGIKDVCRQCGKEFPSATASRLHTCENRSTARQEHTAQQARIRELEAKLETVTAERNHWNKLHLKACTQSIIVDQPKIEILEKRIAELTFLLEKGHELPDAEYIDMKERALSPQKLD